MPKSALKKAIILTFILFSFSQAKPVFAYSQDLFSQPFLRLIQPAKPESNGQVIIAVIDEGIDFNHPDLAEIKYAEKNFIGWKNPNLLLGSHGTQVAGVIAATTQKDRRVKLMSLVACGQSEGCDMGAIIKAIYYAADNGANIINLSFEVTGPDSFRNDFNDAIAYAYRRNAVVVVSAGNGDENHNAINLDLRPVSPVCNDNGENMVLGVSSIDDAGDRPSWANFGSCVDVYAPGSNLYTTLAAKYGDNNIYAYKSGTSYSAGIVSAEAALVKLKYPLASARQIADLIKNSSRGPNFINISEALSEKYGIAHAKASLPPQKNNRKLPTQLKKTVIKEASAGQVKASPLKPRG